MARPQNNTYFSRLSDWKNTEFQILAILFTVAGVVLMFLKLASEILEGETHAFDSKILLFFRIPGNLAQPIGPLWLDMVLSDITALGGGTVLTLITCATLGFLWIEGKRSTALLVLASVAGGTLLSTLLKNSFDRPRPELVPHLVEVTSMSFPSGHAMLSAITYLTLGALLARSQAEWRMRIYIFSVCVFLTLIIGISRVYLGVHWPTDVLGGWCIGAGWAMLCWLIALKLQKHGDIEQNMPPR